MRSLKEKLTEFVVSVVGGTLLIAGLLSLPSDRIISKVWIVAGVILVVVGQVLHRRQPR